MEASNFAYTQEVEKMIGNLRETSAPEESLDRLHRLGIWSRRSIVPRGSLFRAAANRLSNAGEIQLILFWLRDAPDEIRRKAALVIGQWGGEECIGPLAEALREKDIDPVTRLYCLSALRNIGGPRVVEAMVDALRSTDSDVQDAALSAVVELATGGSVSDTESPRDLGVLADVDDTLPTLVREELRSALSMVAGEAPAKSALRYRAVGTLEFLEQAGLFQPEPVPSIRLFEPFHLPAAFIPQGVGQGGLISLGTLTERREATGWVSAYLAKSGAVEEVKMEILPPANAAQLRPLVDGLFYWSVNNRVVVTLRIPHESIPADTAELRASVVVPGVESPIPSHDLSAVLRPDSEDVFEFDIPPSRVEVWCREPKFFLTPVDAETLSLGGSEDAVSLLGLLIECLVVV